MRTISDTVIILSQELFVTSGPPVRKKQTNVSLRWKNFLHPQFLKTHSKSFAAKLCANISITLCWPKVSTQFQKSAKYQSRVCLPKVKTCTHCTRFQFLRWSCFLNTIDPVMSDYIGSDLEINNKILMFPLLDYTSARQVIWPKFYTARF